MGEEPGQDVRACQQVAGQDQDIQAADRGGRGDCRPQPGQVPQGPAGAGGNSRTRFSRRDGRPYVRYRATSPKQPTNQSPIHSQDDTLQDSSRITSLTKALALFALL